jgi:hypothetical protein
MATITLPIEKARGDAARLHFKFRYELDGEYYRFAWHYNGHFDSWFLDLYDDGDVLLVGGQRIKLTSDAWAQFRHLDIPQGTLRVVDAQDQHQEATRENFGTRVLVKYDEVE